MDTAAKKQVIVWLQRQFSDCEVLYDNMSKEPAGSVWMRVYFLREASIAERNDSYRSEIQMNFSIFTNDLNNIYTLDMIEENLRKLIERRKLCVDAGQFEFREFDTANLDQQPSQQVKLQKAIEYKSIMVTAYFRKRRS